LLFGGPPCRLRRVGPPPPPPSPPSLQRESRFVTHPPGSLVSWPFQPPGGFYRLFRGNRWNPLCKKRVAPSCKALYRALGPANPFFPISRPRPPWVGPVRAVFLRANRPASLRPLGFVSVVMFVFIVPDPEHRPRPESTRWDARFGRIVPGFHRLAIFEGSPPHLNDLLPSLCLAFPSYLVGPRIPSPTVIENFQTALELKHMFLSGPAFFSLPFYWVVCETYPRRPD